MSLFQTCLHNSYVIRLQETQPEKKEGSVFVKMLAATINPADINMIQGTYGANKELPAVAGNEGVGVVEDPGSSTTLSKGDWVIPRVPGSGWSVLQQLLYFMYSILFFYLSLGTWTTEIYVNDRDLVKIPNDLPVEYAAGISSNPCTAYRLLSDFANLQKGLFRILLLYILYEKISKNIL